MRYAHYPLTWENYVVALIEGLVPKDATPSVFLAFPSDLLADGFPEAPIKLSVSVDTEYSDDLLFDLKTARSVLL